MSLRKFFVHWILPGLLLAAVLLFDYFFLPGAIITPACSYLILAILAFVLPPIPMFFWAIVYYAGAAYTILYPDVFMHGPRDHRMGKEIWLAGLFVMVSISVALCLNRIKGLRKSEQMKLLVKEIPLPVILSNRNGEIIFINSQSVQLLGVSERDAVGDSYFSLVTDVNEKGHFIQRYLEIFEAKEVREEVLELRPKNNPDAKLRGTLIPADGENGRYLITIIYETNATAVPQLSDA